MLQTEGGEVMKRFIMMMVLVFAVAGCQSKHAEEKFEGITAKQDFISQGMQFLAEKKIPEAIKSFDQAIKNDPRNVNNYLVLGQVYMKLNNPDAAADTFQAATYVDPNNGEAFYLLAASRAGQGRKKQAIESAQKSVDNFMKVRDEENFKKAVVLLKSLTEQKAPAAEGMPAVETPMAMPQ